VCALVVIVVFAGITRMVDWLVESRDAQFRRTAFNSLLLQGALARGQVALDGLVDDPGVFGQPEGRAFMALFPFLALSNSTLEERLAPLKDQLIGNAIRRDKTPQQYYDDYVKAVKETHAGWRKYAGIPVANDEDLLREQDKAWNDYVRSLSRRGWTPQTVPSNRRGAVVSRVRKQVPVAAGWDPGDEAGFRAAVERKYHAAARGVRVGKEWIGPGLSYEQFVARPAVQAQLRTGLALPADVVVAPTYPSPAAFRKLYDAMVARQVRTLRARYDAPASEFEPGGAWFKEGEEAARAVIVPPVALFCSLLGAIGHLSKLLYLLATLALLLRSKDGALRGGAAWLASGVLLSALALAWTGLSHSDNRITSSELFRQLVAQVRAADAQEGWWTTTRRAAIANITHVVAVGQGYSYPFNEAIRINVLQGMTYGYHPKQP
jgi:hypothetical protein